MVTLKSPAPFAAIQIFLGAIVPLIFAIAISMQGDWKFGVNTLSDLGVSSNASVAGLFNWTCIIAGLFVVIVGLGKMFLWKRLDAASAFFLALGGVFLIGIGLITKDYSAHNWVAYLLFACIVISMIIGGISDWKKERKLTASVTIVVFVASLASCGLGLAGVELVAFSGICLWFIAQGLSLAFSNA